MRIKAHTLALAAVLAAVAVSPAVASADPWGSATSRPVRAICHTDYSRNSVDGQYCVATPASAHSPGYREVGITSVAKVAAIAPAKAHDGFSWGNASVGAAGAVLAVIMLVGTVVLVFRRRRDTASPVGGRSATTG